MAGSNVLNSVRKLTGFLVFIVAALALSACDSGDGAQGVQNSPAVPLPELPAGFCDPINFELLCPQPDIVNFNGGSTVIVDNPDRSGINLSETVARMQKFADQPFGGTRLNPVETPVEFTDGEAYTIKVWSERAVPLTFKLEETTDGTLGVERVDTHDGGSTWQELCFDFTGATPTNTIGYTLIFDNGTLGAAIPGVFAGPWTFYYDEITQVRSCTDTGPDTGEIPDVTLFDPSGTPDLEPPDDYLEITGLGSGSIIDLLFANDSTYSPVAAISSGTGLGANVAQIGFIGFDPGFLTFYESIVFKAKALPNNVIFVRLIDGSGSRLRINLTSSAFAEQLNGGWYQVSIPLTNFAGLTTATGIVLESDNTAPMQFTMLLTDIGFSDAGTGGGDNGGGGDSGGTTPLGVFSETSTSNTITITDIVSAGNTVLIDAFSTSVTPFDGTVSLELEFTSGGQAFAGAIFQFVDEDISAYDTLKFAIDTSTFANLANLTVQLEPPGGGTPGGNVLLASYTPVSSSGDWDVYEIPLADFTAVNLGLVNRLGFFNAVDSGGALIAGTLYLDDIHFTASGGGSGGGGAVAGLAVNGDFETGDFASWQQSVNSGVQTISTDTPADGGSFSAALSANTAPGQGGTTEIKQANLGAGTLALGDVLTISFDVKGSFGPGGQLNVLSFTEFSGGGGDLSDQQVIAGGVDDWTTLTYNVTLSGSDAGGGFSLAFNPVCGAVEGCVADVFIDNVSIVLN